jgi:hypothetical protein
VCIERMHARFGEGASKKGLRGHLVGVLLYKNLGEVMQKTLAQQIDLIRQAGEQVKQNSQQSSLTQPDGRRRKPPRRQPPAPSPRRAWQMAMHKPGA